jgi:hypothetical protein
MGRASTVLIAYQLCEDSMDLASHSKYIPLRPSGERRSRWHGPLRKCHYILNYGIYPRESYPNLIQISAKPMLLNGLEGTVVHHPIKIHYPTREIISSITTISDANRPRY